MDKCFDPAYADLKPIRHLVVRGRSNPAVGIPNTWPAQNGERLSDRDDIQTMFDYIDADEGRPLKIEEGRGFGGNAPWVVSARLKVDRHTPA